MLGVAVIQCLLAGAGFLLAGIPGAGVLAIVCLVVGIIQLPLALPMLPVIGYWVAPTNVHFSGLMLVVGVLYSALSAMRRSFSRTSRRSSER